MSKIRPLPADLQQIAIKELNEVPERLDADIEALRTWIDQQPHLNARTDDQFLVAFLRGCKFSLERAKSKIDMYYALRTKYPEHLVLNDLDDPKILELIKMAVGVYLPMPLNGNGPRLLFVRGGIYPPDKFSFSDIMKIAQGTQAILLMNDDYAVVNGVVGIMDMSHMTAGHMMQLTPTLAKRVSYFGEEALPIRQKGSHMLGLPSSLETLFNTFKPLMPVKQQKRMYIHGTKMESLYEHIPLKYLPKEYGGENGSLEELGNEALKNILDNRDFLLQENKFGVNEKLRPGKALQFDTIFGIDGSFRQLNVD